MEDYEAFARTVGALVYNTSHVDIIQLALSEPEESAVFKAAKNLTLQRLHVYTYEVTSLGPLIHNVPDNQKIYRISINNVIFKAFPTIFAVEIKI